jgi:mRNA interferase RelE/StbE
MGGTGGAYRVEISVPATKRLKRLPRDLRIRILAKLRALGADPVGSQPQAKPLKGRPGVFRLRIGDWRATYVLDHGQRLVTILEVEPGHDVY